MGKLDYLKEQIKFDSVNFWKEKNEMDMRNMLLKDRNKDQRMKEKRKAKKKLNDWT